MSADISSVQQIHKLYSKVAAIRQQKKYVIVAIKNFISESVKNENTQYLINSFKADPRGTLKMPIVHVDSDIMITI